MDTTTSSASLRQTQRKTNQNIQVYVRVRPLNAREHIIKSTEVVEVTSPKEIITRHAFDMKLAKRFTFDRTFGPDSRQMDVYSTVVAPLIEEVLAGYNCTVFAYGQTGTGKTHTMVGNECAELKSSWEDDSEIGIIPRALSHLFDELRMMEVEFTMRISYLELYNEELCDLLSTDDNTKIRIFDDSTKKGSVIIQGLEEIIVHSKDDVYKLLEKGKERRKTATTLMNAQSSRSHTVFSIVVHIRENGNDGEEMLKIGKLNLVDLAGSENVSKAGNEKGIRVRETVNINQSLLTLGRVITALVERTPHIPYRESKLTRLLQESLGGRTKTSIIATVSPGHKDLEETLSTLEYAHRAKNIQNKPEVNQKLTKKTVIKEYTEEIDKLRRELVATRDKNGIYLPTEAYDEITLKMESQNRELNEKMLLLKAYKDELQNKEKIFAEVSMSLVKRTEELKRTEQHLIDSKCELQETRKMLSKTKRRYKERDLLLGSHVRTEKELTSQATKILEVADTATEDTTKLHKTIERRKDVEQKIISAAETFAQRMQNNFDTMNDSLQSLRNGCNNSAQMLHEELSHCTNVQNRMLDSSDKRIEDIRKACLETISANQGMHETFVGELSGLSEQHHAKFNEFTEKLKHFESQKHEEINANLKVLTAVNEEQRAVIQALQADVAKMAQLHTTQVGTLISQIQARLQNDIELSKNNITELLNISAEIQNDEALMTQEQKLLDDFVRQMQWFKAQRQQRNEEQKALVKKMQLSNETGMTQMQESIQCATAFGERMKADNDVEMCKVENKVVSAIGNVDKNNETCALVQMEIDALIRENVESVDNVAGLQAAHFELVRDNCNKTASNAKRIKLEQEQQLTEAVQAIRDGITDETQRVRGHVAVSSTFVDELVKHVDNYADHYDEQVDNCRSDLLKFKQSELQTYTPTGETPARRNFSYPRVLAATSPDISILRRFRRENDWSDLDSTAQTIDEASEAEDEQISVQEFTGTATILNSTEFSTPEIRLQKRDSNIQQSGTNLIKQTLDATHNTSKSISLANSSSLNLTLNSSPALNNKENIG